MKHLIQLLAWTSQSKKDFCNELHEFFVLNPRNSRNSLRILSGLKNKKPAAKVLVALVGAVCLLFPVLLASNAAPVQLATPARFISDEVGDDGAVVDTLDDAWRTTAQTVGATAFAQIDLSVVTDTNPLTVALVNSLVVTISNRNTPDLFIDPNSLGELGGPIQLPKVDTLQGSAPRPASLFNAGDQPPFWNENSGSTSNRNGVLFEFSQPVQAFGVWVGDLETRTTPNNGTPALLRLVDANRQSFGDTIIAPTLSIPEQINCNVDTFVGCGNGTTRWVGFVSDTPVQAMLIVVGDDDPCPTNCDGNAEHISWIGGTLAIFGPDLSITKDDGQTFVAPGEVITYTLTLVNRGLLEASGILITDTLPLSTTFLGASDGGIETAGLVTWSAFNLAANASLTRTITLQVDASYSAGSTITNTAVVTYDVSSGSDPILDNNRDQDIDTVGAGIRLFLPIIIK